MFHLAQTNWHDYDLWDRLMTHHDLPKFEPERAEMIALKARRKDLWTQVYVATLNNPALVKGPGGASEFPEVIANAALAAFDKAFPS
jgi:hypothetical protein